jgi:hypothetical protein
MPPITGQLKTSKQLQQAGLPRAAAVILAGKIEAGAQASQNSALEHFRTSLEPFRVEILADIAELRADFHQPLRSVQSATVTAIRIATGLLAAVFAALTFILHGSHQQCTGRGRAPPVLPDSLVPGEKSLLVFAT